MTNSGHGRNSNKEHHARRPAFGVFLFEQFSTS